MAAATGALRRRGRPTVVVGLVLALAAACLVGAYYLSTSGPAHARVPTDRRAEATLTHRHRWRSGRLTKATTLTISGVTVTVPAGWYVARTDQSTSTESNAMFVTSSAPLLRTCPADYVSLSPVPHHWCPKGYVRGRAGATTVMWIVQGAPTVPFRFDCRVEGVPAYVSTVVEGRASTACRPEGLDRGGTLLVAFRPSPRLVIQAGVRFPPGDNEGAIRMITTAQVSASS